MASTAGLYPSSRGSTSTPKKASFATVIGPSGCGKTTLLNIIAGLEAPDTGTIELGGGEAGDRLGSVGYMLQKDLLMPWRSVLDNAILPLELRGVPRREARIRALGLMETFGLEGFENQLPSALSGGMRQRVAFLRTVLTDRDVILLDEPFGALDAMTRTQMQEWLLEIWERLGKTIVLITHDVEEAILLSDRIYLLTPRPGRVKLVLDVTLPRPRNYRIVTEPSFIQIKGELLAALHDGRGQYGGRCVALTEKDELRGTGESRVQQVTATSKKWAPSLLIIAAVVGVWQGVVYFNDIPHWKLPAPKSIGIELWESRSMLLDHTWVTLQEVMIGFAIALVAGVLLATVISLFRTAERVIYPSVIASQTVPIIVIAPLLLIWVGYGMQHKVIVVALISFFPIVVNTVDGLRSTDPDMMNLLRTMGASRWQVFTKTQVPSSLPFMFSGIKIAITVSVIGAVIGRMGGLQRGPGVSGNTFKGPVPE